MPISTLAAPPDLSAGADCIIINIGWLDIWNCGLS
jgi:hypothetical protein